MTGVPVAQLVRIATENYLDEVESSGSVRIELKEAPTASGLEVSSSRPDKPKGKKRRGPSLVSALKKPDLAAARSK